MWQSLRSRKLLISSVLIVVLMFSAWYGSRLRAQDTGPITANEAARQFIAQLSIFDRMPGRQSNLIAQKNIALLTEEGANRLYAQLFLEFKSAQWKTEAQLDENGNSAIVEFTPSDEIKPVVCVKEGNRWRVDIVATYQRWKDLSEQQSLSRISDITGVAIPGVAMSQAVANRLCQTNLKQIALGVIQYTQDNDELYPPANKWSDVLRPYFDNEKSYHCPTVGQKDYGYAMNWKLSRQSFVDLQSPAATVMHYESNVLQRNRNGDGKDLTFRHEREGQLGANYSYADGHVKWNRQTAPQSFRLFDPPVRKQPNKRLPSPSR